MPKYSDWYAVELDGYLKGRLSDVQRFEATNEILNHFAEHVEDLVGKGMDPIEAEKAAIKSFGSPRTAAISLLNRSKVPALGKMLSVIGVVGMGVIVALLGMTYQQFYLKQDMPGWGYFYLPLVFGSFLATTFGLIFGTTLSKKVPYSKMGLAWCFGIAVVILNFSLKSDIPFAQVPTNKFESTLAAWNHEQQQAFTLGKQMEKIYSACKFDYSKGYPGEIHAPEQAAKLVIAEAPRLLATKSTMITLDGPLTAGFIGPSDESPYSFNEPKKDFELGEWFPRRISYRLRYFSSAQEAVRAWSKASRNDSYSFSMLSRASKEQLEFINDAVHIARMTKPELFIRTVGPFTGISLGIMLGMMLIGFALVRIPNITIYTSFRRRVT